MTEVDMVGEEQQEVVEEQQAVEEEQGAAEVEQQAPTDAAPVKAASGEPEEEPWRKRLWFVRMPRPPEAGGLKGLEQEVESYRTQFNLITEALNVKKVERDSAREATRAARDAFNQCRAAYDERAAPARQLQKERQEASTSANKLKDSFGDLLVKSEAELDSQLAGLHYRIEHESISLNEEKKAMATIKKLEQQRERVREFESSASLFAESRAKRGELQDALKEYEGELKALRQEMDMQRQILDKLREAEKGVDKEVEEVIAERRRCRELMEQAYGRLTGQKKEQRAKNNIFYSNRSFSRDVRKLLADGKLEEARAACAEQMDQAHAQLEASDDFRAEYFALWEQQRKAPVLLPGADDVDANLPPPSKGAAKGGRKAEAEPVDPTKKAEATIAALLEEAREEAKRVKAAAAAAEHASAAAGAAAAAAAAVVAAAATQQPGAAQLDQQAQEQRQPREIVGLDAEAAEAAASSSRAHAARAPKQAAAPSRAPVVEPVVVPEENFELPEVVRMKDKVPSSELKEVEREHNRQAQAEADRRKQRKQQDKERKKQRQDQLAKEAEGAAARAAEAANAAQAAAAAAAAAAADAAADDSADSDSGAAAAAAPASSAAELRKRGGGGGSKQGPLPVARVLAPKPAAKRPAAAKKQGLVKAAQKAAKEYSMPLMLAAVLLVMFVLFMVSWTNMAVAPQ